VVWAGGVDAPPWVKALGLAVRHGRVVTGADLRVPGHPDTFAIGDLAAVPAPGAGGLRPQLAQVAIQTAVTPGARSGGTPPASPPHASPTSTRA
jgi:NADH:quinone reductase (non-electrogenic)